MMTNTADRTRRLLGFTVYGDFIQSEGIDPVLDNLERAGATNRYGYPQRPETGSNRGVVAISLPQPNVRPVTLIRFAPVYPIQL
jgi:hypothetical protein